MGRVATHSGKLRNFQPEENLRETQGDSGIFKLKKILRILRKTQRILINNLTSGKF